MALFKRVYLIHLSLCSQSLKTRINSTAEAREEEHRQNQQNEVKLARREEKNVNVSDERGQCGDVEPQGKPLTE